MLARPMEKTMIALAIEDGDWVATLFTVRALGHNHFGRHVAPLKLAIAAI